jgi:hypothetical protein
MTHFHRMLLRVGKARAESSRWLLPVTPFRDIFPRWQGFRRVSAVACCLCPFLPQRWISASAMTLPFWTSGHTWPRYNRNTGLPPRR